MVLCYVTDRHLISASASIDELLKSIEHAAGAGVDWIQIREKDLSARELAELTRRAITTAERAAVGKGQAPLVFVNDRLDVALAAGAAGVHLSATSISPADAVKWLRAGNAPADFCVGVSCHSRDEAIAAEKAGASYVFFGPIYETPSKLRFGEPQGTEKLAETCGSVGVPVLAIGGVNEGNAAACIRAGASGIAAIRMFQQADLIAAGAAVSHLRALR
jgi:thiamine-phosphate pyrophosphorylase